ncbi:MAG: hypothetical protein WBP88_07060 [Nitrososphaeraceae archaeon]
MKMYFDPGQKFSLVYPAHWFARGTHDSITGTTEIKLSDPDSTRLSISVLYSPNDPLFHSKTGKSVVPARASKILKMKLALIIFPSIALASSRTSIVFQDLYVQVMLLIMRRVKVDPGRCYLYLSR